MFRGQYSEGNSSSHSFYGMSNSRGLVPETATPPRMMLAGSGVTVNNGSGLPNAYVFGTPGRYEITARQQAALMPPPVGQMRLQTRLQASGSDYPTGSSSQLCYPMRGISSGIVHHHRVTVGDLSRSTGSFAHGASSTHAPQMDFGLDLSRRSSGSFGAFQSGSPRGSQVSAATLDERPVIFGLPSTQRPDTPRPSSAASVGSTDSFGPLSPSVLSELRRCGYLSPLQGTEVENGLDNQFSSVTASSMRNLFHSGHPSGLPSSQYEDDDDSVDDMFEFPPSSQPATYTQQWH